jgi:hypothetical protein
MFSFVLSSSSVSIAPGGTASVTITQTDSSGLPVTYRISSVFPGGFNDCLTIDEAQVIGTSWAAAVAGVPNQANFATITDNGTATLYFTVAAGAAPDTVDTYVYGLVQIGGYTNANQPTILSQPISVTVT